MFILSCSFVDTKAEQENNTRKTIQEHLNRIGAKDIVFNISPSLKSIILADSKKDWIGSTQEAITILETMKNRKNFWKVFKRR